MTKQISKLLTTAEVVNFVNLLKGAKDVGAAFAIAETDECVTVTHRNKTVFKSLSKGNGAWITRFNEDLFIA